MIFAQESAKKEPAPDSQKKAVSGDGKTIPILSQYSNTFKFSSINFNKKVDVGGRGEVLEVEMELVNLLDDPQEVYIFSIATFEKCERTSSSFEAPIPEKDKLRSFVAYPNDIKNFEYPDTDKSGNTKKDDNGKDKVKLIKFPKNPLAGVNPDTGKPYLVKSKLVVRTNHLSLYRNNYFFFNNVTVLVFDKEGKPVYKRNFELKNFRR